MKTDSLHAAAAAAAVSDEISLVNSPTHHSELLTSTQASITQRLYITHILLVRDLYKRNQ